MECRKNGVTVLNNPEAGANAVAELTLGLMIALLRHIPLADRALKEGKWAKGRIRGWELKEKTLGILGLGKVGARVARMAKMHGMKILVTKRTPPKPELLTELEAEYVTLRQLLQQSDVVTIHVPLTRQTTHLIGEDEFQLMKKGAFLINTSRGAIVEEKALFSALKTGQLGRAALDVYEAEPPKDFSLVKMSNIVSSPHIGTETERARG